MAELVDALVSNTSGSNAVPVRSRLRVHKNPFDYWMLRGVSFFKKQKITKNMKIKLIGIYLICNI